MSMVQNEREGWRSLLNLINWRGQNKRGVSEFQNIR